MPQPKSSATSAAAKRRAPAAKPKATAAKKPAARATAASRSTATSRSSAAKPKAAAAKKPAARTPAGAKAAPSRTTTAAKRTTTAAKRTTASARKPAATATKPAAATSRPAARPKSGDPVAQLVGALREQLSDRVLDPLNLVMLAGERIQEAVDEAVERGRMTRGDANDLVGDLVRRGRQQTDDVLGNLDELLGKGLDQLAALSRRLESKATRAARRAESVDRLMRGADRARRAVGTGPSFPILGYDDLSAAKISARLGELKPAELRKVRDYERRHANRKSVLAAIDKALG